MVALGMEDAVGVRSYLMQKHAAFPDAQTLAV